MTGSVTDERSDRRAGEGSDEPRRLTIDPRIRERLVNIRREEGRRRLLLVAASTAVVVVGLCGWGITRSPLMSVRHVRVAGTVHTSVAEVTGAAGLAHHRQMVDLDDAAMAKSVMALPWVQTARVARRWPTTVVITVTERHPIAIIPDINGWATLDGTGRVLAVTAVRPGGLPEIAEVGQPTPAGGPGTVVASLLMTDLTVASNLVAPLSTQVAGVAVTSDGQVELIMVGGVKARLGPVDDLAAKLTALATMMSKANVGHLIVDVRVPTAPVLTAPGPGQ